MLSYSAELNASTKQRWASAMRHSQSSRSCILEKAVLKSTLAIAGQIA
jgi:hypothetical protein